MEREAGVNLKSLVGAGDRVVVGMLPFAAAGIAANLVWPTAFRMDFGAGGRVVGIALLVLGGLPWLWAVAQVLTYVPRGRLITTGPFALVLHPIYTFVALLVIPGIGLVLDTWAGFAIGAALYVSSRIFSPSEERQLAMAFPADYAKYRARVLLRWL
jgi:protein-S-isoprenylcysteine O-methyltransferase Ste14